MGFKRRHNAATIAPNPLHMDIDEFWHLIALAGQRARRADDRDGNQERFAAALGEFCARAARTQWSPFAITSGHACASRIITICGMPRT